jgi:hypothetical protein
MEIREVSWIEAAESPWRIRVLDVRPVTLGMMSTSPDPECAANALSYGEDNGTEFLLAEPPIQRTTSTSLLYRITDEFWAGALFRPQVMEHKWAIFYHFERIFFVRSWQRIAYVIADTRKQGDFLEVHTIRGAFLAEDEPPEFSCRVLDFLLRTHALGLDYPAPLLPGLETDTRQAALWCFASFGNMAQFASLEDPRLAPPDGLLRILDWH